MLPQSIYSMAKLYGAAISCVETGNNLIADHCRSVRKLTGPNITKARLPCCTLRAPTFFPCATLYVWRSTAGAEQRDSPTNSRTNEPTEEKQARAILIPFSPVLRNAFKLFKSFSITLRTLLSSRYSSGAQSGL